MKPFSALLCGSLFGLGLAISGMTDTQKVIGFLDLFGNWVPDLAFVMGGALVVTFIGYRLVLGQSSPLVAANFHVPTNTVLDKRLISGALIFGVGWGLYGYCPGPALASLVYLNGSSFLFLISMLGGMLLLDTLEKYGKA